MKPGFEKVIEEALKAVNYKDSSDNVRLKAAIMDLSGKNSGEGDYMVSAANDEFLRICSAAIQCESNQIGTIKEKASSCLQNGKFHTGKDYSDQMANFVVDGFLLYAGKGEIIYDFDEVTITEENGQNPLAQGENQNEDSDLDSDVDVSINPSSNPISDYPKIKDKPAIPSIARPVIIICASLFLALIAFSAIWYFVEDAEEISFVPDYTHPDKKIVFEVPPEYTIMGPDLTTEIGFSSDSVYGMIDSFYAETSGWIFTEDERITLWKESGNWLHSSESKLKDDGFIEIDGIICSWFMAEEKTEPNYSFYLVIPFSEKEEDSCLLELHSNTYEELKENAKEIIDTISIKRE